MTPAVFDSNVIISGAAWRGAAPFGCLVAVARQRVEVFTSNWILEEVERTLKRLIGERELGWDPMPVFNWFVENAQRVDLAPTGKPRSRDPKNDPILGTALSARARYLVTNDKDLLVLERPFGIAIVSPAEFLRELARY